MKKILISSVAMFALAFAVSASAATVEDMGSATLKKGSSGAYVMALQKNLNTCAGMSLTVDGKFGKGSAAAAMSFQSMKGLVADGVVGSKTKVALAAACTGSTVTSSVPGCTPGAMFSSTTGASCSTGTPSTTISGGAGNIQSIITLGSPSSTTISEGDSNKPVLGFEVKADSGSDLKVTNIGIRIAKTSGSGSTWVSRYVNKLSIMQGSTVIGTIDAASLSQNGNDYTANIAVDNAIVKANMNAQFYVAVNANSTIDTSDSGSMLTATVTSIRYMDATGAVLTNSAVNNQSFTIQKLSLNANVKLQVSEDNSNPRSRTVTSNYTSSTQDVTLLKFNVTAYGSNLNLNEIDVIATTNNTVLDEVTKASQLFKLKKDGVGISTVNFVSGLSGSTARVVKFGDTSTVNSAIYTATSLNGGSSLMIPAGQTAMFEVTADIKPIAATGTTTVAFEAGDVLKVNLPSAILRNGSTVGASVTPSSSDAILTTGADGSATCTSATAACWSVLDQSGNNLSYSTVNRQGSATGYDATFRVQGLSATLLASSQAVTNTYNNSGVLTTATVPLDVSVTAAGSDFFIPRVVGVATSASDTTIGTNGFLIAPLNNAYAYSTPTTNTGISGTVSIVSGATVDGSGKFKVGAGQTAVFRITATVTNGSTPTAGSRYVQLNAIGGSIDAATAPTSYPTVPASSFQSSGTAAF